MERALACTEIVEEIFEYLFKPGIPPRNGCLFSLAQVSRAFSDCALDLLWRDLPHISLLFRIVDIVPPASRPGRVRKGVYCKPYMLRREITTQEWDRFWAYASRLRVIHTSGMKVIHDSVWEAVSREMMSPAGHRGPLFPRLVEITPLRLEPRFPFHALDHLLVPTVHKMSLRVDGEVRAQLEGFAERLRTVLLQLDECTADHDTYPVAAKDANGRVTSEGLSIWELAQLRSLTIGILPAIRLTGDTMFALRSFSHLRFLNIGILEIDFKSGPSEQKVTLQSLDTLMLQCVLNDAVTFCSCIVSPRLRVMRLTARKVRYPAGYPEEFCTLHNFISLVAIRTLRVLDLDLRCGSRSASPSCSRSGGYMSDILSPLRTCDRLETLKLNFPPLYFERCHDLMYDNELRELVNVWPNIIELMIRTSTISRWDVIAPSPPTIRTIADFARFHPRLTHLYLPCMCVPPDMVKMCSDAVNMQPVLVLDSLPVLDHGLKFFKVPPLGVYDVPRSPGDNESSEQTTDWRRVDVPVMEYAMMLDRVFPHIERHALMPSCNPWDPLSISLYESMVLQTLRELQARRKEGESGGETESLSISLQ